MSAMRVTAVARALRALGFGAALRTGTGTGTVTRTRSRIRGAGAGAGARRAGIRGARAGAGTGRSRGLLRTFLGAAPGARPVVGLVEARALQDDARRRQHLRQLSATL